MEEPQSIAKTERIELRVTSAEKSFLIDMAKLNKISLSQYIIASIIQNPKNTNKEIMNIYNQIIRNIDLGKQISINKAKSFYMYVDKNALRRIFDSARFSLFHFGDINMDEINIILDGYQKVIDLFPEDIQKVKQQSIKELFHCRNKNYLIQKLKLTNRQMGQTKSSHSKELAFVSRKNVIEHGEKTKLSSKISSRVVSEND